MLLARSYVYGLALNGEDGVRHVPRGLITELDLRLGLSGYADVAQLSPDALMPNVS